MQLSKNDILEKIGVEENDLKSLLKIEQFDFHYCNNFFKINGGTPTFELCNICEIDNKDINVENEPKYLCLEDKEGKKSRTSGRPIGDQFVFSEWATTRHSKNRNPYMWKEVKSSGIFERGHIFSAYLIDSFVKGWSWKSQRICFCQTKWSNRNDKSRNNYSQWYFEEQIKEYLEKGNTKVAYKVRLIYRTEKDTIPIGIHLQALGNTKLDNNFKFNVFLPNIDPNYIINYETGEITKAGN